MKKEPFTWRGLKFAHHEQMGSQQEGWFSSISMEDGTAIFLSVREYLDGSGFVAFTTPPLSTLVRGASAVDALEELLKRILAAVQAQANALRSLQ